jgi:cytochrome P450
VRDEVFSVRDEPLPLTLQSGIPTVKVPARNQPSSLRRMLVTKPKVVFDPFSEEFFNNPFDIYRRMREDAPLYYDEKEDFYALTRHEDVAAAFKDFETYSSAVAATWRWYAGHVPPEQKSIIFMDPPEHRHMRSLLNKAFTPRAISPSMNQSTR